MATEMVPRNPELESQASSVVAKARAVEVIDQQSHDQAAQDLQGVAALEKQITNFFKPFKDDAHRAHKRLCDAENDLLKPLKEARPIFSQKILGWERHEREKQAELQRAADAEARRLADEAALRAATEAEAAGASEDVVEEILSAPPIISAPIVAPTFQRSAGITAVERWHCEIVSLKELLQAVVDGRLPESYVTANMVALNAKARTEKSLFKVPGCKAVSEEGARVSTR